MADVIMNTPDSMTEAQHSYSDDDLLNLQKMTAQRADELSRQNGGKQGSDLEIWLTAEREVLEHYTVPAS